MDKCSYFLKDKAIFGSYPTQENVYKLEKKGVKYFINLTYPDEKLIVEYETNNNIIRFPIKDRKVPNDIVSFSRLVVKISNIINDLKENQLGDVPITYADISKAKKLLNYNPQVKLDRGLYNNYNYIINL